MTKRQWVGVFIAVVVLIVLVIAVKRWDVSDERRSQQDETPEVTNSQGGSGNEAVGSKSSETFSPEVPKNAEITKGAIEVPAAPGAKNEKLRVFDVSITKDGYNPSEIVVNQGDSVNLRLTANGGDYDIAIPDIGLQMSVPEGENRTMAFQALVSGTFTYLCKESCPPSKIIKGSLVVK